METKAFSIKYAPYKQWLYLVEFNRFVKSSNKGNTIYQIFVDEYGKRTRAMYRMYDATKSIYRLDGRSIRYMRRAEVIEN